MNKLTDFKRPPQVHYPASLDEQPRPGKLWGLFQAETNFYNVISLEEDPHDPRLVLLGRIVEGSDGTLDAGEVLLGSLSENNLTFLDKNGIKCLKHPYSLYLDIFSRNTGILESDVMQTKKVVISGCGSVGSLVALELARSGVGTFVLIDHDLFAYHNICRHECGIYDVGRFKTEALKDRILQINPAAQVIEHRDLIESTPKEIFDTYCSSNSLIVGCADNREADKRADEISQIYKAPFISIGLWERAFAGEIFYSIPERNHKTYHDLCLSIGATGVSERPSANRRIYTNEQELVKLNFEPGISVDIHFVTLIAIKIALDILTLEDTRYAPKVLGHLTQFTLVCNTNDPKIGGDMAEIFSYPLQVTSSIEI